ncbi:MAG: SulP family inorganic anion transporter [Ilumatobacter sp.]
MTGRRERGEGRIASLRLGLFDAAHARSDVAAGLTVAAMLVPQAMAYAQLANLPPEVGLYASTLPVLVYALLGTSRQLSIGPVAIVSLVSATALGDVARVGTTGYLTAAGILALLVGGILALIGLLRAGFLVRLLSHPVLTGFTAAAAIIIGTSQLSSVLGTAPDDADGWAATAWAVIRSLDGIHPLTVAVGVGAIVVMVVLRRWKPKTPVALVAVAGATVISVVADLDDRDVDVVGTIPSGLPPVTIPTTSELGDLVGSLLPSAFTIALVAVLEAVAVARVYAREHRYDLDPNREFVALGASNLATGIFGGAPLGGALSRTAVNNDAGARTRFAGVVAAAVVVLVLVVLTPLFEQLPQAVLGAIVLLAVVGLFDTAAMRTIWRVRRADAATMAGAFVATLVLGVDLGILVAVVGSAVVVTQRIMQPHVAVLGRQGATDRWRDVTRYPSAQQVPGVTVVRFDTSLNYLNVEFMKDSIRRLLDEDPHALVLDFSSVNDIDTSAVDTLEELVDQLAEDDVVVYIATYQSPVTDLILRTRLPDQVAGLFDHVNDAARAAAAGPQPPRAGSGHRPIRVSRRRALRRSIAALLPPPPQRTSRTTVVSRAGDREPADAAESGRSGDDL